MSKIVFPWDEHTPIWIENNCFVCDCPDVEDHDEWIKKKYKALHDDMAKVKHDDDWHAYDLECSR